MTKVMIFLDYSCIKGCLYEYHLETCLEGVELNGMCQRLSR